MSYHPTHIIANSPSPPSPLQVLSGTFQQLTEEDDIRELMGSLIEVLDKWKFIGVDLGLKMSKLKTIEEENRGNPKSCFLDVLTNWLNRNYNTKKFGEPSWQKVVEAVANPAAGDNVVLAETIAKKHQCECQKRTNDGYIATLLSHKSGRESDFW